MSYFVYDTETSGLPLFSSPHNDPRQPKLVQLAGFLYDDDHNELASISTMVQPDGWVIHPKAEEAHGISLEKSKKYGASLRTVCEVFAEFIDIADVVVNHNIRFDTLVMRHNLDFSGFTTDVFAEKKIRCTMMTSTPILKIKKPTGGFKWPSLAEALTYFCPEEVNLKAHDAMHDARACASIYRKQVEMGLFDA